MNIKNIILTLALCVMAFVSCRKDEHTEREVAKTLMPTETIKMTLLADAEEDLPIRLASEEEGEEMRLAQEVDLTTGKVTQPFMDEKNLEIRVSIRRGTGREDIRTQTLTFTKVAGEHKAKYSGEVEVPPITDNNKDAPLEIAAIVLKEEGDGGREFTTIDPNDEHLVRTMPNKGLLQAKEIDGKHIVESRVPYVATWSPLTLAPGMTALKFKPRGALIRIRITNPTTERKTIKSIRISSSSLYHDWGYNFRELPKETESNGYFGLKPSRNNYTWERSTYANGGSEVLNLPVAINLDPKATSGWYYFYATPNDPQKRFISYTEISLFSEADAKGDRLYAWASNHRFANGTTSLHTQRMVRPYPGMAFGSKFPEERIPASYIETTEDGFVKVLYGKKPPYQLVDPRTIEDIPDAYYTAQEVLDLFSNGITIDGKQYHIPSHEELQVLTISSQHGYFGANALPRQSSSMMFPKKTDLVELHSVAILYQAPKFTAETLLYDQNEYTTTDSDSFRNRYITYLKSFWSSDKVLTMTYNHSPCDYALRSTPHGLYTLNYHRDLEQNLPLKNSAVDIVHKYIASNLPTFHLAGNHRAYRDTVYGNPHSDGTYTYMQIYLQGARVTTGPKMIVQVLRQQQPRGDERFRVIPFPDSYNR